jgi:hypothetical protein
MPHPKVGVAATRSVRSGILTMTRWLALPLMASAIAAPTLASAEDDPLWWFSQKTIVAVEMFGQQVTGQPISEAMARKALTFTAGSLLFTALHESGHMLVSELGLPVLGKEEDAVDAFATAVMLLAEDPRFDRAIRDSASEWWLEHDRSVSQGYEIPFYDEHSPEKARAFSIACLAVGARPADFGHYATVMGMPQDRQDRCHWDWEQTRESWDKVLEDNALEPGKDNASNFTVSYEDLPLPQKYLRSILEESTILDTVSQVFAGQIAIKDHITFQGARCGEANAYWSPDDKSVTMCYELVQTFLEIIFDEIVEPGVASAR